MSFVRFLIVGALGALALAACGDRTEPVTAAKSRLAAQMPKPDRVTACEAGVKAFKTTVHALLRRDCAQCHDTGGIGPAHSVSDLDKSYGRIMAYVNWSDIDNSRFVKKGGNQHCLEHPDGMCKSTFDDIKKVLHDWWDQGQKDCPKVGKYLSNAVAIPASLPTGELFTTMRWPLNSIDPAFNGAYLEMEIQQFSRGTYYMLRKPRLVTPAAAIRIEDLKILVNGKYDAMASSFQLVRATIGPVKGTTTGLYPLLSTGNVLVAQDKPTGDEIQIGFEELKIVANPECKAIESFRKNVLPAFQARSCYKCHGGGPDNLPGRLPTSQTVPMKLGEADLCSMALQRANGKYPGESPLISLPVRGLLGHPRMFINIGEVFPDWLDWLKAEAAAP